MNKIESHFILLYILRVKQTAGKEVNDYQKAKCVAVFRFAAPLSVPL
jgi:hypothetical protein